MPKKIPNYEKEYIKALRINDFGVLDLLECRDEKLLEKISNFAYKHGFDTKDLIIEIKKNEYLRAVFSKDPGKQKIHENIAAQFIKSLSSVKNFKQLSTGDLTLLSGAVMPRTQALRLGANRKAKTIDFSWVSYNNQFFASHKYTKESGGAQDNQYRDLQEFIREANQSNLINTYFLAIADGDYYSTRDAGAGIKKIEVLKRLANRNNVLALSSSELEAWLQNLKN